MIRRQVIKVAKLYFEAVLALASAVALFGFIAPPLVSADDDLLCFTGFALIFIAPIVFALWACQLHKQLKKLSL